MSTRLLVRGVALKAVLDQHEAVVQPLSEYAKASSGQPACKARGLLKQITCGQFVLGVMMCLPTINLLENLNRAVQSRSFTISGAVAAMDTTMVQVKRRYDQPDIQTYTKLESIILKSVAPCPVARSRRLTAAVQQYSELDGTTLHTQLAMVKQTTGEDELSTDALVSKL